MCKLKLSYILNPIDVTNKKICRAIYNKEYYNNNKQKILEKTKEYYKKNKDKILEKRKEWYKKYYQVKKN